MDGRATVTRLGFFERLKLGFRPLLREDPEFGSLSFVYVANRPDRSYWEAEWLFPPVGYRVAINLDGDLAGPTEEARSFYRARVIAFEETIREVRPQLEKVAIAWLDRPLAVNLWDDLKLAGLGTDDLNASPRTWDISFETTGKRWLGITVPMIGDRAQEAQVDT